MNEVDFTKGFNNGYLLAKHTSELMQKLIASIQPENDYLQGMLSGSKQHEMEMQKTNPQKEMDSASAKDINKDRGQKMDINRDDR